jgi:lipoprotein-anchoring transpeptidase ErfK/SrfK
MARHLATPSVRARAAWAVSGTTAIAALALGATLLVAPASANSVTPLATGTSTAAPTATPTPTPTPPPLPLTWVGITVTPANGSIIGVGYPITVHFSVNVSRKALAERHMRVFLNGKGARGAWFWKDARTAMYRQINFWPGHARILVRFTLGGVELARSTTRSYVGLRATTRAILLRTPRSFIAKINAHTDRMTVLIDGKVVKVFGVSLGKPGFETRSGIKTTMDRYLKRHMTSQELGLTNPKDQYDLWAPYSVRITYSGEFVHGAPWAASRIGRWNGSHGCTNLFTADAKWFYTHTIPGDVVVTTGTSRTTEYYNSLGAVFNMPWKVWLAHSALKGK